MNFLVFQHIDCEHPGIFRTFMAEYGINWQPVRLNAGEAIPDLACYDALLVMGGPMDVWQNSQYPWLVAEKEAISHWVAKGKPFLGLCLGHQLLADSLGGRCQPCSPEVGILDVALTPDGSNDILFKNVDPVSKCLQWHSVEVSMPPNGAQILAQSSMCRCQAIKVGDNAYGIQYHLEIEPDTISNWGKVTAYAQAMEQALGNNALIALEQQAVAHYANFERNARTLFSNFLTICA